jgi:hypothetical protein
MTGSRAARLILALTALLGQAAPDAAVGYSCFRSDVAAAFLSCSAVASVPRLSRTLSG